MHPRVGKRSKYNATEQKKQVSKAVEYIHLNTKKSITIKQEYLYLEDVKTAMNIHHLEQNIRHMKWMIERLKSGARSEVLIRTMEESIEKDRHRLQKTYRIKID
jgi:hypothetical protein